VSAYRPIPKPPKGVSLPPPHGSRTLANVIPAQGGAKRLPGPIGMDVLRPDDETA